MPWLLFPGSDEWWDRELVKDGRAPLTPRGRLQYAEEIKRLEASNDGDRPTVLSNDL